MKLSALDLHHIVKELDMIIGAKVEKIYHPKKHELIIQFYIRNVGKKIIRVVIPDFMYLTEYKQEQPQKPSGFCTFLRRYLDNARLREINQFEFERIIEFVFEKEEKFRLIFELFSKGNIILCKEDYVIISPLQIQHWKLREIKPKVKYIYPQKEVNFLDFNENELKDLMEKSKKNLVKLLAVNFGLGGIYAEELCLIAGVDKEKQVLTDAEIKKITKNSEKLLKKPKPRIVYKDNAVILIIPSEIHAYKDYETKTFNTYNEALDSVLTKRLAKEESKQKISKHQKKLDKLQRIIDKQKEHVQKQENSIKDNTMKAELIYSNYKLISDAIQQIKEAQGKYSWNEIKKKLKGNNLIKSVDSAKKEITIDIK